VSEKAAVKSGQVKKRRKGFVVSALSRLLELDERLLKYENRDSLEMAARLWENLGSPSTRPQLINFLEDFLKACQREGRYYAPILLRRKRELQRGDFQPKPNTGTQATPGPITENTVHVEREIDPAVRAKIEGWKQQLREKGFL